VPERDCVWPVIEATAPGKLVIVGEYAVLHGAPGISVAVDVCALARLEARSGPDSELLIPDTGERFRFHLDVASNPVWEAPSPGALGLPLESCIATLRAHGLLPQAGGLQACRIELDTAAFHSRDAAGQRIKLGLGSSAAVSIALMGALLQFLHAAPLPSDKLGALCLEAHRRLQGGSGSGIDVATALAGGVISIGPASHDEGPRTTSLSWPPGLHMLAIWSGSSASTPVMLSRLHSYREQQPAACASHMAALSEIAAQTVSAWRSKATSSVLASLDGYASALRNLDQDAGIGIYSGGHEAMRGIALTHGAVYKPSGAGGGDFGIALTASREVLAALRKDFAARGYLCLEAGLCAPGLRVQTRSQA
jgi:phosphomevalonate kinase